tara:strand:+ start:2996 stop:3748 length:753 start_codon:yes stop_codon:yes gene_type:complete
MNKAPAFQFYADDFLGGVADMTQSEVGAYILLLCQQWNRGSIPVETERQQLLAKGKISDHVLSKFPKSEDGSLKNDRLEKERMKQAEYRDKQREKGLKSAQARAEIAKQVFNRGSTVVQPNGQPEVNSPSPSPSPSPKNNNAANAAGEAFKKKAEPTEVPVELQTAGFLAAWANWETHRKEKRQKMTPLASKMQLNKLKDMGEKRAVAAINFSIASGWTGIYEERVNNFKPTSNSSIDSGRIAPHTGGNY